MEEMIREIRYDIEVGFGYMQYEKENVEAVLDEDQIVFVERVEYDGIKYEGVMRITREKFMELTEEEFVKRYNEFMYYNIFEVEE